MDKTLIILGILVVVVAGVAAAMVVTSPSSQEAPMTMPPAPGNPVHPVDPTGLQNDKLTLAKQFVMDDATFQFDGMADTMTGTIDESADPAIATVEFTSRNAGFGNRSGMMLAEVLTPHTAIVKISNGQVVSAVMDGTWDMMSQKVIAN